MVMASGFSIIIRPSCVVCGIKKEAAMSKGTSMKKEQKKPKKKR